MDGEGENKGRRLENVREKWEEGGWGRRERKASPINAKCFKTLFLNESRHMTINQSGFLNGIT